jgi:uncharacterized protein (TIGR02285 family)
MKCFALFSRLLGSVWLAGCGLCLAAPDKPVMTWLIQDFPPLAMPVNGQPTVGVTDVLLRLIAQQWPQVEHRYVVSNTPRGMASLANGEQACFNGAVLTPERERFAYFTVTNFVIPLQLITRPEVVTQLPRNTAGEVLLDQLFDKADLRGLLVRQRSYLPQVDALLANRVSAPGIDYAVLADGGGNIFKMVALSRADYTLDYDFALTYQQHKAPGFFKDRHLLAVPVAGMAPFLSGIACPRTPWGRDAIMKIDALVAGLAGNKAYMEAANRWLTPESIKRYKEPRAEFFRKRLAPTDPAKFDQGQLTPR